MKLADIPIDAWEVIPTEKAEELLKGATALYGTHLRVYGAVYGTVREELLAIVIVWMGPIFMAFHETSDGKTLNFDDQWPELARWHAEIVKRLVWPSEE